MSEQLTARVQKLSKNLPDSAMQFSSATVIEADEAEGIENKGTLYAVFDVSSTTSLDPLLVVKIVHDVLHDSYFNSELASPIQTLEKSIVAVKDKVTELSNLDFNILAAALIGNVLYMVQFGKGGSFLVREGAVKPVNSATEGNFSEASGVVRGDDVVILGTQFFIERYNPNDLVSGAVSFSVADLPDKASALLIKFDAAASSVASAAPEEKTVPIQYVAPVTSVGMSMEVEPESTLSIAKKVPSITPKITLRSTRSFKVKPVYMSVALILVLLGGSILWTVRGRNKSSQEAKVLESAENVLGVDAQNASTQPDTSKDTEFKIFRITPEAFYDIKIVDETASPTDLEVLDNSVVAVDQASGKIFTSSATSPKFAAESLAFPGIKSLGYFGGDLAFADNEGYKIYALGASDETGKTKEAYAQTGLGPSQPYLASVYSVSGDTLTKYQKGDKVLSGSVWAQSAALQGAVSLAIDGNIYVLKSDGSFLKFYTGDQVAFEIKGLDKAFSNPTKVIKDVDLTNIYVADSGNNRVVVLDDAGNLVKQFVATDDSWNNIRSIGVSRDEKTLFVLSGSKVYQVAL